MPLTLAAVTATVALISIIMSPRALSTGSFFRGQSPSGESPGVWALAFSQVTTWIFARSLMNAAILGFYFGIAGTLAYAGYYLSFITGWLIIDSLRFKHGYNSVQDFLNDRFGRVGPLCYNLVVGLRLISEIFANLLVIGILFGATGSAAYGWSMGLVATVTLGYALLGGLHASIRTDAFQFGLFAIVLAILLIFAVGAPGFDIRTIMASSPDITSPGWILLLVAAMQVWSYPMHDPVMMDRGFIADRNTTKKSFLHAAWISLICIMTFGMLGVYAGLNPVDGGDFIASLTTLIGDHPMILLQIALVVSCMSTLDSTYSSAAKLAVVDVRLAKPTLQNGRLAMVLFLIGGLLMVYFGSKDLFSAVAVSGTASLFLAPVIFFSLWLRWDRVATWSYIVAFITAMIGAGLYFTESSGYSDLMTTWIGLDHKYAKLALISAFVLVVGCGAFIIGRAPSPLSVPVNEKRP